MNTINWLLIGMMISNVIALGCLGLVAISARFSRPALELLERLSARGYLVPEGGAVRIASKDEIMKRWYPTKEKAS